MILEAVWFKDGKEIDWVDPVVDIICDDKMQNISDIEIYNGHGWYSSADCDTEPDDFVIRIKRKTTSDYCN